MSRACRVNRDYLESSVLLCRIARVGGDSRDTFTGVAFGLSFDIHLQIDSPGSVTEYPAVP